MCTSEFYTLSQVCDHMDQYDHWPEIFECEGCSWTFDSRAQAKAHMQEEDHWVDHRCQPCNKGFENENNLRQVSMPVTLKTPLKAEKA